MKKINKQDWLTLSWLWTFKIKNESTWVVRKITQKNLIPTVWREAFAAQMSGDNITDIWDNLFIAVGSNAAAPVLWDTQLWTETTRKTVSSTSFAWAIASIAVFFASGEATGNHQEFGLFGDWNADTASGSINTWILFSHVSASVNVSAAESLTITFELTFS